MLDAPDAADAYERLDQVVETRGRVVLDRGCAHHELAAGGRGRSEVAVVLGPRMVEIGEVPPVVDDALRIRVREPDARERRVLEGRAPARDSPELWRARSSRSG